jgi:hypothetical protein
MIHVTFLHNPDPVNSKHRNMTDTQFNNLKLRDLRQLEKALQTRVQLLSSFKIEDHENNAMFLTLAPEGITIKYKADMLQAEINHCEMLLERIQMAILAR